MDQRYWFGIPYKPEYFQDSLKEGEEIINNMVDHENLENQNSPEAKARKQAREARLFLAESERIAREEARSIMTRPISAIEAYNNRVLPRSVSQNGRPVRPAYKRASSPLPGARAVDDRTRQGFCPKCKTMLFSSYDTCPYCLCRLS